MRAWSEGWLAYARGQTRRRPDLRARADPVQADPHPPPRVAESRSWSWPPRRQPRAREDPARWPQATRARLRARRARARRRDLAIAVASTPRTASTRTGSTAGSASPRDQQHVVMLALLAACLRRAATTTSRSPCPRGPRPVCWCRSSAGPTSLGGRRASRQAAPRLSHRARAPGGARAPCGSGRGASTA